MRKIIFLITLLLPASVMMTARDYVLASPDGKNVVTVSSGEKAGLSICVDGVEQLSFSGLAMKVGGTRWGLDGKIQSVKRESVDEEVDFVVPRRFSRMRNTYNSLRLRFRDYDFELRSYNDGIAYRFVGKKDAVAEIDESASVVFPSDYECYASLTDNYQNWFEKPYTIAPVSELDSSMVSMCPLMVNTENCHLLFADANLYDYAGFFMRPSRRGFTMEWPKYPATYEMVDWNNKRYAVERYDYIVKCNTERAFPWRVVGIFPKGNDAAMLTSELIWLLSEPAEGDWSWVRPGKTLWDWWMDYNIYGVDFKAGINTETYLYMIDHAAAHGYEYLLIDEGWSEHDSATRLNPEVDMPAVCAYAAEKGVGILLWVKWVNLDKEMENVFRMVSAWGVKGLKIDFMDRNDAEMVNWFETVAKMAADYRMLIEFHGSYPNEGMRRKYPNLMTREGVYGAENDKWHRENTPEHHLHIPFIREWVGPMAYTPGSMRNAQPEQFSPCIAEPMSQGTRCHNMAMYVLYESPIQMLADSPVKYNENPAWFDFLEAVPSVWDETVPVYAKIGERLCLARRSGDRWFIGCMNGVDKPVSQEIRFDFLDEGEWEMLYYKDGINAGKNAKDYAKGTCTVNSRSAMTLDIARNGGFVAIINRK